MAKPTLNLLTGTEHLGLIYKEQMQINVKYLDAHLIFTNSAGRLALKTGVARFIMIQGAHDGDGFSGTTQAERLKDFVDTMEGWVDTTIIGYAQKTYTDSHGNAYGVDPLDFTWTRSFNDPNRVIYSLMLVRTVY